MLHHGQRWSILGGAAIIAVSVLIVMGSWHTSPPAPPGTPTADQLAATPVDNRLYAFQGNGGHRFYGPYYVDGEAYIVRGEDGRTRQDRSMVWAGPSEDYAVIGAGEIVRRPAARRKVLGTMHLYWLTRHDPLFYSPLAENLSFDRFKDYEKRLAMDSTGNARDDEGMVGRETLYREVLQEDLFAHRFFENLSVVDRATERFYSHPSYENGERLLAAYTRAAAAYQSDLGRLIRLFNSTLDRNAEGSITQRVYQFQNGASTNLSVVLQDFQVMNGNVRALEEDIVRRRRILSRGRPSQLWIPEPATPPSPSDATELSRQQVVTQFERRSLHLPAGTVDASNKTVSAAYGVRLSCQDTLQSVRRLSHGYYPEFMVVDAIPRVIIYPEQEPTPGESPSSALRQYRSTEGEGVRYPENPPVTVDDRGTEIVFTDNRTGQRWTIKRQVSRPGGGGIGRAVPIAWHGDTETIYGVTGETDMTFTGCNCPYFERTYLQWFMIDRVRSMLTADPLLTNGSTLAPINAALPEEARNAVRDARRAERLFLDRPSIATLNHLEKSYRRAVVLLEPHGPSLTVSDLDALDRMRRIANGIAGRTGAMQETVSYISRMIQAEGVGGYGSWIFSQLPDDVSNPARVPEQFTPIETLGYSLLGLAYSPESATIWRSAETPQYFSRGSYPPKRVLYPVNRVDGR